MSVNKQDFKSPEPKDFVSFKLDKGLRARSNFVLGNDPDSVESTNQATGKSVA